MALGRSAPMLMMRLAARGDGAGAGRGQRGTGSSPTIAKFCSTDSGRQRHPFSLPPRARARRRQFQRALTQTDLHRPAGRRCGCWPTSTFLFSGIVVRRFGGDDGARAIGADADVGFAGRAAAMVPAPVEGSEVPGHRQRSPNSAAPTVEALPLLAQRCGLGKISGIWQRQPSGCPHARARGGANSSAL